MWDWDACKQQWNHDVETLSFVNDLAGCVMFMMDHCDNVDRAFDCQDGFTAECAGNLTALGIETAGTGKLGKLGPVGAVEGDALAAAGEGSPALKTAGKDLAGCAHSFDPKTLVLMADGSTKPIKSIAVGDAVMATDPENGTTDSKTVTILHDNVDTDLANLTVVDRHGNQAVVHTTQSHPFWDATTNQWTRVDHLDKGDWLLSPQGRTLRVVATRSIATSRHMLNLTVADLHTYYVLAGNTPVLVHNCGGAAAGWAEKADFSDLKTLSKKYDAHASDFGITGNRNNANLGAFREAMTEHMTSEGTSIYRFNYRGQGQAVGFIDSSTNKMVMLHADSGKFWSAYRLGDNQFAGIVDKGFLW
jgi:hypothetical protein